MDEVQFRKLVKENPVQPIYFLYGDEPFFIDRLGAFIIEQTVDPAMRDFNFSTLYGKEVDSKQVLDMVMRFPMMAEYHVVQLKEAHQMRDFSELLPYIVSPLDTTVLIIEYKRKPDGRTKIFQQLRKLKTAFESKKVRDYQIGGWIEKYCRDHQWKIEPRNAHLLGEHLGTDLQKIANELDKVMLNKSGDTTITADDIEKYVGISKEYNVFELQKAIGLRDDAAAARIASVMAANERDFSPVMVISVLFNYFVKIYKFHFLKSASPTEIQRSLGIPPFFIREYQEVSKNYSPARCERIFELLYTYDLRSKGIDYLHAGSGELIKELVFTILDR